MSDATVAGYIRKAIDEFRKTDPKHLKQVDVVIYEQRMLGAFQAAFSGSGSAAAKAKVTKSPKTNPVAAVPSAAPRKGNVAVNVTGGDILTSNCEVMINTTGGDFNLSGTMLHCKINSKESNQMKTKIIGPCTYLIPKLMKYF